MMLAMPNDRVVAPAMKSSDSTANVFAQGIWLEKLRNWGGVEDERDGLGWFALIGLKPTR